MSGIETGKGSGPAELEGADKIAPGSNTSQEPPEGPALDSIVDAVPEDQESGSAVPFSPFLVTRRVGARNLQNDAQLIAQELGARLEGVRLGQYVPEDTPRDRRIQVLKAEALWRAGLLTVAEICTRLKMSSATLYEWRAIYHWPDRDDIARIGQEAARVANLRLIAQRARTLAGEVDTAPRETSAPAGQSESGAADLRDPDTVNLLSARGARPMSEADAMTAAVREQASAAAAQDAVTSLFVEQISLILAQQQDNVNLLVSWGTEMLRDLHAAYQQEKNEAGGRAITAKSARKLAEANLPLFKQMVSAITQAIGLQSRVWMIGGARAATEAGDAIGASSADDAPRPIQRDSYEDYVFGAERAGINLTKG